MDRSGIRILIVDDHEIFRAGLRLLLENEPDLNVIGEGTVRHYLTSIFAKLQVADRPELMIYAYQHDLATLPSRAHARKLV